MGFIILPLCESSLRLSRVLFFLHKFTKYFNCPLVRYDTTAIELVFLLLETNDRLMIALSLYSFFG